MDEPKKVIASPALAPDGSGSVTQEEHDNWIAEVSHELRLPLANIKLLVETLIDGAVEEPITAMRMLSRTKEEVTRLQNLVNDLLSHEKLQNGRAGDDMRFSRVNIQRRTESCLETTRELAEEKGVILKSAVESGFELLANCGSVIFGQDDDFYALSYLKW
jgi:two-component system phosphate regulon sensor histidine kinase PhoR